MSTHAPIDVETGEQPSTSPEPTPAPFDEVDQSRDLRVLQCPRDGQILEVHHKRDDGLYECPRCSNGWPPWEVFSE